MSEQKQPDIQRALLVMERFIESQADTNARYDRVLSELSAALVVLTSAVNDLPQKIADAERDANEALALKLASDPEFMRRVDAVFSQAQREKQALSIGNRGLALIDAAKERVLILAFGVILIFPNLLPDAAKAWLLKWLSGGAKPPGG